MPDLKLELDAEKIGAAYPEQPVIVAPETTIHEVFQLLNAEGVGSVLVCEAGSLVGIFTERDALKLMASRASLEGPIRQVMSRSIVTIREDESVAEAVKRMAEGGYRRLPIVNGKGCPTGVAGVAGILHYLADHFPRTIYNLPPDPQAISREREGA